MSESMAFSLVEWFEKNQRPMAWRDDPTPYHVWISEIMLQQTRVDTVRAYYDRFLRVFPTVSALAEADEETLLKQWEGLGYYSRARNLQKAAKLVVSDFGGEIPGSYEELRKLPGIGSYTAGAILSIAFHKRYPVVDGNVLRVLSRALGRTDDIRDPKTKERMEEELRLFLQGAELDPGAFNQALMELGAIVCLPNGAPKCEVCPWARCCIAGQGGLWDRIPVARAKEQKTVQEKTVFLVYSGDRILLEKRSPRELLSGMSGLPLTDRFYSEDEVREIFGNALSQPVRALPVKQHVFTHRIWKMKAFELGVSKEETAEALLRPLVTGTLFWAKERELKDRIALPTAFRKWPVFGS